MNEDENSDIEFNYDLDDVDTSSAKMSIEEIFEHTAAEVDQSASQPFRFLQKSVMCKFSISNASILNA